MGVVGLGYVHIRATDLAESAKYYGETMGLLPVLETPGKAYFKGWDEWDHHSFVIEEGGVGVVKVGFKTTDAADLDEIERKAQTFGVSMSRMSKGENPEVSDGLRITLPSTHIVEVYHEQTVLGPSVGTVNPEVWPQGLKGIGVPRLDHALLGADDPGLNERFFLDVLGFFRTECVVPDLDHEDTILASWLAVGNRGHDVAILGGPGFNGKLHHVGFQIEDWSAILHAAQTLSMARVPIDYGPGQHGITRGKTIYFFDPSGNRDEVFADGYVTRRDRKGFVWTADQLGAGIMYPTRQLNEAFTTVLT